MPRNALLLNLLIAALLSSCSRPGQTIPEPNYNPHILKPTGYVPTHGKKIDMDSVAAPKYRRLKGRPLQLRQVEFVPPKNNRLAVEKPKYVPATGKLVNMDSVARPRFYPAQGKRKRAGRPQWHPVRKAYKEDSPFAYLNVKQGLHSPYVFSVEVDRMGRVWIGHHDGMLGVWDEQGVAYYSPHENLIPSGGIFSILEDRKGQIWIASGPAVSVWDGENFTTYTAAEGLTGGDVQAILEDHQGRIWIGTREGMNVWDPESAGFTRFRTAEGLSGNHVHCLLQDGSNRIWIGTDQGLSIWNPDTSGGKGKAGFTHFTTAEGLSNNNVLSLLEDRHGRIWIGTDNDLNVWDGKGFTSYTTREGLVGGLIKSLLEDRHGRIWIGAGEGISVWNGKRFINYTTENGISSAEVWKLREDRSGQIWIGTWGGGVSIAGWKKFDQNTVSQGLNNDDIWSLAEGPSGRIWIGSGTGGVDFWYANDPKDPEAAGFFNFIDSEVLQDGDPAAGFFRFLDSENLGKGGIQCLLEDRKGRIWIGTRAGGLLMKDGAGFTLFSEDEGLNNNDVQCLLEDREGHIWIGTHGGGLHIWDGEGLTLYTEKEGLTHNGIYDMTEDRAGRIWIATFVGVCMWDGTGFTHFTEKEGLSDGRVWSVLEDQEGRIWIGTNGGGVNVWDGQGLYHYTEAGGLTQDIGSSLTQDKYGNLWIGTYKGLNQLSPTPDPHEWGLITYHQEDGLAGISIHDVLVDQQNQLWLGTSDGLNHLDLNQLPVDTTQPTLFLTDVQPFFESIDWRQVQDSLQTGGLFITEKQQIALSGMEFDSVQAFTNLPLHPEFPHHINDLTFQWSGTHTVAPHKLLYSYFLEGNDAGWSPPLPESHIRLQNLPPGNYAFKLRAVGINGRWSETTVYQFSIRPPWYAGLVAYLIYTLIILALFYGFYRFQLNRRLAKAEAQRLRELDTFKSNLYTNITHEFRTPLTVIMGMTEEIRGHDRIKSMISRNSRDLLQLVNQMLDLSKLEVGALQLNRIQADVLPLLKYLVESFHSAAAAKGIRLLFQSRLDILIMDHDPERLRQLLTNLLANALKFTPVGGEVVITTAGSRSPATIAFGDEPQPADEDFLLIKVSDSGSGIPKEQLPFIFDRFYQADNSVTRKAEGAGIGLALVKELVTAMEGSISVESQVGRGTEFLVRLPVHRKARLADTAISPAAKADTASPAPVKTPPSTFGSPDSPLALIVEDNKDVADYLKVCLQNEYQIQWAQNGREGLGQALEIVPDIIITDVMMPEMDGFTLCQTLKNDERTSHIPIIMLTARATREDRLQGLEKGADVYLMKPFDKAELELRLRKLIELRRRLQAKYSNVDLEKVRPEKENDPELLFLKRLQTVVLEHLADETFQVEPHLCRAMTMSRPQLYRKLKALRDVSPSEYLRSIRMQHARQLLLQSSLSISEVAERVGFKESSYFTKVYLATFGELPSRTNH